MLKSRSTFFPTIFCFFVGFVVGFWLCHEHTKEKIAYKDKGIEYTLDIASECNEDLTHAYRLLNSIKDKEELF